MPRNKRDGIGKFPSRMGGAVGWILATLLTFAFVSLAFLLLASLANNPPEISLVPDSSQNRPGSTLAAELNEEELSRLQPADEQPMAITITNGGAETISYVSVIVEVSSENTARTSPLLYEERVEDLAVGESRRVDFEVDLSDDGGEDPNYPDGPRRIVEVRATAPDGLSDFETAIFPVGVNTGTL